MNKQTDKTASQIIMEDQKAVNKLHDAILAEENQVTCLTGNFFDLKFQNFQLGSQMVKYNIKSAVMGQFPETESFTQKELRTKVQTIMNRYDLQLKDEAIMRIHLPKNLQKLQQNEENMKTFKDDEIVAIRFSCQTFCKKQKVHSDSDSRRCPFELLFLATKIQGDTTKTMSDHQNLNFKSETDKDKKRFRISNKFNLEHNHTEMKYQNYMMKLIKPNLQEILKNLILKIIEKNYAEISFIEENFENLDLYTEELVSKHERSLQPKQLINQLLQEEVFNGLPQRQQCLLELIKRGFNHIILEKDLRDVYKIPCTKTYYKRLKKTFDNLRNTAIIPKLKEDEKFPWVERYFEIFNEKTKTGRNDQKRKDKRKSKRLKKSKEKTKISQQKAKLQENSKTEIQDMQNVSAILNTSVSKAQSQISLSFQQLRVPKSQKNMAKEIVTFSKNQKQSKSQKQRQILNLKRKTKRLQKTFKQKTSKEFQQQFPTQQGQNFFFDHPLSKPKKYRKREANAKQLKDTFSNGKRKGCNLQRSLSKKLKRGKDRSQRNCKRSQEYLPFNQIPNSMELEDQNQLRRFDQISQNQQWNYPRNVVPQRQTFLNINNQININLRDKEIPNIPQQQRFNPQYNIADIISDIKNTVVQQKQKVQWLGQEFNEMFKKVDFSNFSFPFNYVMNRNLRPLLRNQTSSMNSKLLYQFVLPFLGRNTSLYEHIQMQHIDANQYVLGRSQQNLSRQNELVFRVSKNFQYKKNDQMLPSSQTISELNVPNLIDINSFPVKSNATPIDNMNFNQGHFLAQKKFFNNPNFLRQKTQSTFQTNSDFTHDTSNNRHGVYAQQKYSKHQNTRTNHSLEDKNNDAQEREQKQMDRNLLAECESGSDTPPLDLCDSEDLTVPNRKPENNGFSILATPLQKNREKFNLDITKFQSKQNFIDEIGNDQQSNKHPIPDQQSPPYEDFFGDNSDAAQSESHERNNDSTTLSQYLKSGNKRNNSDSDSTGNQETHQVTLIGSKQHHNDNH